MRCSVLASIFLALVALAVPASAAPIVVGLPAMTNNGNCYPFGCAYDGEYQQVYDQSAFPGSITITGLEFYNTSYNSFTTMLNSGNWTISLSTTAADWNTLSGLYSDNLGPDNTVVFSGDIAQPWTFGDTLSIVFSTPFTYDPSAGNLLMDVFVSGATDLQGDVWFDFNGSNTILGRVFHPPVGSVDAGYGLVTGFETDSVPVPEPTSLFLLGSGVIGIASRLRKMRRS